MSQKPKNRRLKVIVTEKSSEKWKKGQKAEHFKQREMKKKHIDDTQCSHTEPGTIFEFEF